MQRNLSAMDPAGPHAERLTELTWFFTIVCTVVFAVVVGAMLYAVWRGHRRAAIVTGPDIDRTLTLWVGGGVGVTVVVLLVLLITSLSTGRALGAFAEPDALTIRVSGHQWWWEVEYRDPSPHRRLTTANEIYIPVGRRVRVEVQSADVIHSFWAPSLHGKLDLIPGFSSATYVRADRPGVYDGRCAEFCGLQHAHMGFQVIAVPREQFAAWFEQQLAPAPLPADSLQQKGQDVFLSRGCVLCHTIRGTQANGRIGPDLTHLASRRMLGAATLPNQRGHLAGWIMDAQRIKPGVRMPPNQLAADELQALLAYLTSLR
jgi:cytochrome c oxidase subunit II